MCRHTLHGTVTVHRWFPASFAFCSFPSLHLPLSPTTSAGIPLSNANGGSFQPMNVPNGSRQRMYSSTILSLFKTLAGDSQCLVGLPYSPKLIESLGEGKNDRNKEGCLCDTEKIRHVYFSRGHHHLLALRSSPLLPPPSIFSSPPTTPQSEDIHTENISALGWQNQHRPKGNGFRASFLDAHPPTRLTLSRIPQPLGLLSSTRTSRYVPPLNHT